MRKKKKWDKDEIIKAYQDFINENNRFPRLNELRAKNKLPSKRTITRNLEMSYKNFVETYFKNYVNEYKSEGYYFRHGDKNNPKVKSYYEKILFEQFEKHSPSSVKEFDMKRDKGTPNYDTLRTKTGIFFNDLIKNNEKQSIQCEYENNYVKMKLVSEEIQSILKK